MKKVTHIVADIAAASREQSAGIEQVNTAIMRMDEGTQQNASLVEEAAAASEAIVTQAHALNELIARYKVGGTPPAAKPSPRGQGAADEAPRAARRSR